MKKIIAFFSVLMLAGCFAATQNSTFYILESENSNETIVRKKINIAVQDIIMPDYLQRPQIVLQAQDSPQLKISEFHRWGGNLGQMMQNVLIDDLQKMMPDAFVKPLLYGQKAQYIVEVNVDKLSGYFNKNAVLSGNYKILSSDGRIATQENFNLTASAGKDYASYVKGQSRLLADLASKIALKIQTLNK